MEFSLIGSAAILYSNWNKRFPILLIGGIERCLKTRIGCHISTSNIYVMIHFECEKLNGLYSFIPIKIIPFNKIKFLKKSMTRW